MYFSYRAIYSKLVYFVKSGEKIVRSTTTKAVAIAKIKTSLMTVSIGDSELKYGDFVVTPEMNVTGLSRKSNLFRMVFKTPISALDYEALAAQVALGYKAEFKSESFLLVGACENAARDFRLGSDFSWVFKT